MKATRLLILGLFLALASACGNNDNDENNGSNTAPYLNGNPLPQYTYEFCGTIHAVWGSQVGYAPSSRAIVSNNGTYYLVPTSSHATRRLDQVLRHSSSARGCVYSSQGASLDNRGAPILRVDDAYIY